MEDDRLIDCGGMVVGGGGGGAADNLVEDLYLIPCLVCCVEDHY